MSVSQITQPDRAATIVDDDLELVLAAKDGSITAFDQLVRRHERRMFRVAHHLLHNREDAQDAVQEAFLNAFQKLVQFQQRSKFSTWLTRITVNVALVKLRRAPVYWSSLVDEPEEESGATLRDVADWAPSPETLYTASEFRKILETNLLRLKPGLRAVFLLRDVEDFSLEETAQTLGLTVAAVKARSWRARLQLRVWLDRHFRRVTPLPATHAAVRAVNLSA